MSPAEGRATARPLRVRNPTSLKGCSCPAVASSKPKRSRQMFNASSHFAACKITYENGPSMELTWLPSNGYFVKFSRDR